MLQSALRMKTVERRKNVSIKLVSIPALIMTVVPKEAPFVE